MKSYKSSTPRTAIGFIAIAFTAMTIGLLVVVPAKFGPGGPDALTLARTAPVTPTEVAISPARIDVVGVREAVVASTERLHLTADSPAIGLASATER